MAIQLSTTVRNSMADSFETAVGTSPKLRILTGSKPTDCASAQTGTLLVEITLPSDWLTNASSGQKSLSGTWQANATASGTAGYYRIVDSTGTTCHAQGTVTATGGGGDLELQNTSINSGQQVTITSFTFTMGNS
jgi:hypothetical protein